MVFLILLPAMYSQPNHKIRKNNNKNKQTNIQQVIELRGVICIPMLVSSEHGCVSLGLYGQALNQRNNDLNLCRRNESIPTQYFMLLAFKG